MANEINVYLDAALEYARLGYPVFPCVPGGKSPATGNGFHAATLDQDQITDWWTNGPDYNIAICTNDLIVIDIDDLDLDFDEIKDQFPDNCAIAKSPRGGRHYWHQQFPDRSYRSTVSKVAKNIDTRADDGYILVPPSHTSDGKYEWITPLDFASQFLPMVPEWLETILDEIEQSSNSTKDYMPNADGVLLEGLRNDSLFRFGCFLRRGGATHDEILTMITFRNQSMCQPPLPDKEIMRIVSNASSYPVDQLTSSLITMRYESMEQDQSFENKTEIPDPGPFPEHLLSVPGFVDRYMDYANDIAKVPQPSLWLAGAIAAQGCMCARQICDPAGNYTCTYNIGLASSGKGKDVAYKINRNLLESTFPTRVKVEGVASDAGLLSLIEYEPTSYIALDEFGRFMKSIASEKNSWMYRIGEVLLKMFSAPGSSYKGKAYSDVTRVMSIDNPCITLLGTSVPSHIFEALQKSDNADGLLGRLLFFWGDDSQTMRCPIPNMLPIPQVLTDYAEFWLKMYQRTNIKPTVDIIPYTTSGQDVINDYTQLTNSKISTSGDLMTNALWARAGEKARRLALIYAASRDPECIELDRNAVEWASDVVDYATNKLLYEAQYWISNSKWAELKKNVCRLLRRKRPKGINVRNLGKFSEFSDIKPKEREELLADLLNSGIIVEKEHKPKRGPTSRWLTLNEEGENDE